MASLARSRQNGDRVGFLSSEAIAASLVCAAVCMNFVLAFLNANLIGLDRGYVVLGEVLIVGMALVVCVVSNNRLMVPWAGVIWIMLTIFLVLSMVRESFDPKYLRDVLLIPIFVALGMAFAKGNIVRLFCALQVLILVVMVFEALAPSVFADTLRPWDYYVRTRSLYRESWHPDSGLYISAIRPGGRIIFEWLGIHRLSSIFLEPVSLGNWCIIVTIFGTAFWRLLSVRALVFLILSNIILLIGSDGRLALTAIAIILVLSIFARMLPRYLYLAYLPAAMLIAIVLATVFGFDTISDDFPGRIAKTAIFLTSMDLPSLLGFDPTLINRSYDSGISYLILTQSVVGVVVLWAAICFLQPPTSRHALLLMHGICVYTSLLLMISFSLFSIKTAAPLWFLYGYVRARGFLESRMTYPPETQAT
jgi:putative polymerase